MKRVLYIESGTTGGGSFASMLLNLAYIDKQRYRPYAVFLNETPHKKQAEELGAATYLLGHPYYARQGGFRRRLYRYLLRASARHLPALYLVIYSVLHRRLILTLRKIITEQHIDVVHLNNNIVRDLFGLLACERTGAACVSHLRTAPGRESHVKQVIEMANQRVFAYIAISGHIRDQWVGHGVDASSCRVIHNGIPPLDVKPLDVRGRFKLGGVRTVVCGIGRLVEWKNHSLLVRAFARYRERNASSALLLVGEGPERANLEQLARELGIAPHVVLAGYTEDAMEILAGSDVFVLSSRDEPFGRVTLEAMALKVPVIATRCGGTLELVQENETGLLVSPDDVEELSAALQALSDDAALRRRLVSNGHASTLSRFHIRNCVAAIENVYGAAGAGAGVTARESGCQPA